MNSISLKTKLLIYVAGIVLFSVVLMFFFIQRETAKEVFLFEEKHAINLLETMLLNVDNEYQSILFHKKTLIKMRKEELKNIIDIAMRDIEDCFNDYQSGMISAAEAKKNAIEKIKNIRYNNGIGYLWINDTRSPFPEMIMHPTHPELNGLVMDDEKFNCALGTKKNLFVAFSEICSKNGEGYVDYLWPKPAKQGLTEILPKISHVRLFKPWQWIIGTGVYVDDIEKDVDKRVNAVLLELKNMFSKVHVAKNGYMFAFNGKKEVLIHPHLTKKMMPENTNYQAGYLLVDKITSTPAGRVASYDYIWDKPPFHQGEFRFKKRAYVNYFKPLDWYICSTLYLDDVDALSKNFTRRFLILSLFIFMVAASITLYFSVTLTAPLKKLMLAAKNIGNKGISSVDIPVEGSSETKELGKILGEMLSSIDRSMQKQLQLKDELQTAKLKFYTVIDQTFQFIGLLQPSGEVIEINNTALAFAEVKKEEVLGLLFWETPWWTHSEAMRDKLKDAVKKAADGEFIRFEAHHLSPEGESYYVDFSLKPVEDSAGNIIELIAESRDITERRKAETKLKVLNKTLEQRVQQRTEELKKARDVAEAATLAKSEFLANMSHEIRTPLNGVIAASELLINENIPADLKRYPRIIFNSGHSLMGIINDILDLSKIEARQCELEEKPFNPDELIDNTVEPFKDKAYREELEFGIAKQCEPGLVCVGDPLKIKQVIVNLLSNAFKFLKGDGKIILGMSENKNYKSRTKRELCFFVKDNGIGMTEQQMTKLFQPFSQADSSITRKYGGTGLGLIICKEFVKMMGGKIKVESVYGKGSTFKFSILVNKPDKDLETGYLAGQSSDFVSTPSFSDTGFLKKNFSGLKVLLAEDNPINQIVAKSILEKSDIEVTIAENGKDVLEKLENDVFDAVFMDINMPLMDGYEATKLIRNKPAVKDITIIAMTANALKSDEEKCLLNGMDAYISKPVSVNSIFSTLLNFKNKLNINKSSASHPDS